MHLVACRTIASARSSPPAGETKRVEHVPGRKPLGSSAMTSSILLVAALVCSRPAVAIGAGSGTAGRLRSATPANKTSIEDLRQEREVLSNLMGNYRVQIVDVGKSNADISAKENSFIAGLTTHLEKEKEQLKDASLSDPARQALENRSKAETRELEYWEHARDLSQKAYRSKLVGIHALMAKTKKVSEAYDQVLTTGALDPATAKAIGLEAKGPEAGKVVGEANSTKAVSLRGGDHAGKNVTAEAPAEAVDLPSVGGSAGGAAPQNESRKEALLKEKDVLKDLMGKLKNDVKRYNEDNTEQTAHFKELVAEATAQVQEDEHQREALVKLTAADRRALKFWNEASDVSKDTYRDNLGKAHIAMARAAKAMGEYDAALGTGNSDQSAMGDASDDAHVEGEKET